MLTKFDNGDVPEQFLEVIFLLQIVHFDQQLNDKIVELEQHCSQIAEKIERQYQKEFEQIGVQLVVELARFVKGKYSKSYDVFAENYESIIEIGIENDEGYFPNAYIPIWKCKKEMFQMIGYLTKYQPEQIERKIVGIIEEMLEESGEENR